MRLCAVSEGGLNEGKVTRQSTTRTSSSDNPTKNESWTTNNSEQAVVVPFLSFLHF